MSDRQNRVSQLVSLCVRNKVTPNKTSFCDFILKVCAGKFIVERRTARGYVDLLINAWKFDHWRGFVEDSRFLTVEEKQSWTQTCLQG